ncbi:MAG: hypothetical protein V4642_02415 [Bacteroidota bacterium]
MNDTDKNLYLVICDNTSTTYVDKEFLIKMGKFNQFVRIGETSWLIYSDHTLDDICRILHDSPECKSDIKVDEFTTLTKDEIWKTDIISMMKALYKQQDWITN